jgi:hypothetical protein
MAATAAMRSGARSTSLLSAGRKKVHSTLPDGSELVEEFDARSDELLLRKRRQRSLTGGLQPWTVEVGEDDDRASRAGTGAAGPGHRPCLIRESGAIVSALAFVLQT